MRNSKYLLFFLGMASLTFTGCSTSDNFADAAPEEAPQLTEDEKWVLEANSDVEIKLGTGGNQAFTRAFVEGEDESGRLFTTTEGIGMFCLAAAQKQSSAPPIDWSRYKIDNEGRYMNWMGMGTSSDGKINIQTWGGNVKANAIPTGNGVDDVTRIVWEDHFTRFYPMGNWYNYTFYGYHPYQETESVNENRDVIENVHTEADKVTVDIPIDGYTDVLWGRSYKPENAWSQYAYSGKYFREYFKNNQAEAPVPTMQFKHALSRINFMVAKGDNRAGELYVKELKLMGVVPNKVTLKVADRNTADAGAETAAGTVTVADGAENLKTRIANGLGADGKLQYDLNQNGVELPFAVTYNTELKKNEITHLCDESEDVPVRPNGFPLTYDMQGDELQYTRLGTGIMVPPTAEPSYQLQLTIVLKRQENNGEGGTVEKTYTFVPQFPYAINFPEGLKQGNQYNVYLTIYTPQDIVVNAELVPWENGATGGEIEI